jgi:redox-sensitive bicupin YhaK (pirin superfamily)
MKLLFLLAACSLVQGGEMIQVRKSEDRGHANHGWLTTNYTFSFADYHDPKFMGFRSLRVINEDVVAPGKGFDTHPHKDMEILTYVIEGTLEHKDSMGNKAQIGRGEFQIQTAGSGIEHSEYNPSKKEPVHLLQIWIRPEKTGLKPRYDQKSFADHTNGIKLVISPDGKGDTLKIYQDAKIYLGRFDSEETAEINLAQGRHAWVQVVQGTVEMNGIALKEGDGASISNEKHLILNAGNQSEFLIFDLN